MARTAAGRINRGGVSYDQRTGFKVKGRKLRPDGENPNLWTTDPDELNPQRFVKPFVGSDSNRNWKVGSPPLDSIGAVVNPLIAFGHNSLIPYPFPQLSVGHPPPQVTVTAETGTTAASYSLAATLGGFSVIDGDVVAVSVPVLTASIGDGTWSISTGDAFGTGTFGTGPYSGAEGGSGTW